MTRYHINPSGEALRCQAEKGHCPYQANGECLDRKALLSRVRSTGKPLTLARSDYFVELSKVGGRVVGKYSHSEQARVLRADGTSSKVSPEHLQSGKIPESIGKPARKTARNAPIKTPPLPELYVPADYSDQYDYPVLKPTKAQEHLRELLENDFYSTVGKPSYLKNWLETDRGKEIRALDKALILKEGSPEYLEVLKAHDLVREVEVGKDYPEELEGEVEKPSYILKNDDRPFIYRRKPRALNKRSIRRVMETYQKEDRSTLIQAVGADPSGATEYEAFEKYVLASDSELLKNAITPTHGEFEDLSVDEIIEKTGYKTDPQNLHQKVFLEILDESGIGRDQFIHPDSRMGYAAWHRRDIASRAKEYLKAKFSREQAEASGKPPHATIQRLRGNFEVAFDSLTVAEQELVRSFPASERFDPRTRRPLPPGYSSKNGEVWKRVKWRDGKYLLVRGSKSCRL